MSSSVKPVISLSKVRVSFEVVSVAGPLSARPVKLTVPTGIPVATFESIVLKPALLATIMTLYVTPLASPVISPPLVAPSIFVPVLLTSAALKSVPSFQYTL